MRNLVHLLLLFPFFLFSQEEFYFDTYNTTNSQIDELYTPFTLEAGTEYIITVEGTYSVWGPGQWSSPCGFPETEPIYPSTGGSMTGNVGFDFEYEFSFPDAFYCSLRESFPNETTRMELSLDGGATWAHPASSPPYNSEHIYTYTFTGMGHPLGIRHLSATNSDDYGQLKFTVTATSLASCPDNVVQNTDANACNAVVNGLTLFLPIGSTAQYTLTGATTGSGSNDASGETFNLGVTTVTYTVTDGSGGSTTCSFTVTIEDNEPPQLNCPLVPPATLQADPGCTVATPDYTSGITFGDNCDLFVTLTQNPPAGQPIGPGNHLISVIGTDASMNEANCLYSVTVTEDAPPIAECKDVTVELDAAGQATITPGMVDDGSFDACGPVTLSLDITTFGCEDLPEPPEWIALGGSGISDGSTAYQSLAIAPDGTPYVAYWDLANGQKTTVLKWNGSTWSPLGGAGISDGPAYYQSLAIAPDGTPYAAYRDEVNGFETTVLKWNGSAWSPLGGAGISDGSADYQSLAIAPDGTPYVAYRDSGDGGKTTVLKWNGSTWSPLGGAGISDGSADYQSLAIAPDGTPYVAYRDWANGIKTTVLKWNGATWSPLGGAGISDGLTNFQSLAIAPDGTPYVAYRDRANGRKTTVLKWNGSTWSPLGGAGISADIAVYQSLAIAPDGTPYVAYADLPNGEKTTVLKWNGSAWSPLGGAGISDGSAIYQSLAIGPDGLPYVAYSGGTTLGSSFFGPTTVLKYNPGKPVAILTVTDASGNTSTCTALVTVEDNLPPVPDTDPLPAITAACEVTLTPPTATDNCAGPVTATTADPLTYDSPGTNTVTWHYDDGNGNTSTQTQTVTIAPDSGPTALCQDVAIPLDASGTATLTTAQVDDGSFDACGPVTLSLDNTDFSCADLPTPAGWAAVGTPGISAGNTAYQSLAVAPDGTPYIAYKDWTQAFKTTVLQWDGAAWSPLGAPGISDGEASFLSLAIAPGGTPHVAFMDAANGSRTTVLRWDGSAWAALGGAGISGSGPADYQSLAIAPGGTPYVTFRDQSASGKTTVLRWDGTTWTPLGSPGISDGVAKEQSLAIAPDGTPYVAYNDQANADAITVLQWNGTAWIALGGTAISPGAGHEPSLAIAPDGTPYVAFRDDFNGNKITVLQWNGAAWAPAGGFAISAGVAWKARLAISPSGALHLAYRDQANASQATVLKWDGAAWAPLGGAGISGGFATYPSLAIAPDGTPYLAYKDATSSGKTTVLQYTSGLPTVTLTATNSDGQSAACTAEVTVVDNLPPAPDADPLPAITAECQAAIAPPTATDACTGAITATTTAPLSYPSPGTHSITWLYDDGNGNTTTQTQTVMIEDNTPPNALCRDVTVPLDAAGQATITPALVDDGSFDACGPVTLSLDNTTFTCAGLPGPTEWRAVGGVGISDGIAAQQSLAIALDGTPYVAYRDWANGYETTVLKWNGSAWSPLGGAGISDGTNDYQSLAIAPDGTPYVAYVDNATTVLKWNGTTWNPLGGAGISDGLALYQSLAIAPDGTPFVAYLDHTNEGKTTVLKWNGSTWNPLGGAGISDGGARYQSLAIAPDGTPYVAYSEWGNGRKTTVLQWTGSGWTALGGAGISVDWTISQSLAIAPDGTPYVAYRDGANGGKTTVLKWNGSSWNPLGGAGISVSGGTTYQQSLAIAPDGTPYVAYSEWGNGRKTTVLQWTGSGWTALGGAGISDGWTLYQSLAIAPDGSPYVAYLDDANGGKTTVLKYGSLLPTTTLTVTDGAGLTSTCTVEVTVVDNLPPAPDVDPLPDITADCAITLTPPTATDNCAGTVTATTADPLTYTAPGSYTVTWLYDDGNGNTTTQKQGVYIEDETPPVALCKEVYAELDADGEAILTPAQVDNGSYDACGPVTLSVDNFKFNCEDIPGPGMWTPLGSPDIGPGNITSESIAIAPDGSPYLAFEDPAYGGKLTVLRWDGAAWQPIGSGISDGAVNYQCLGFAPDGSLYAAYQDVANGNATTVLYWDGAAWTALGGPAISDGEAYYQTLAIAPGGTPYVAYSDFAHGNKATVLTWDGAGWTALGGAGTSIGNAAHLSLAVAPDGTPHIAYQDATIPGGYKPVVKAWNGATWTALGASGFPGREGIDNSLAIAPDGTVYLAYREFSTVSSLLFAAAVYAWDGSNWAAVGSGTLTASQASGERLATAPDGTLYLTYKDGGNNGRSTVQVWDGATWSVLGGPLSAGNTNYQSLAISPAGTPYVAYNDNGFGGNMVVQKYERGLPIVTLTVTDAVGNMASCTTQVYVEDQLAPVPDAGPLPDITAGCEVNLTPPTATDNCTGPVTATTADPLSYPDPGTYSVNWLYDDGNGNTTTQVQTVIIDPNTPPVALCRDVTVPLDATGQATLAAAQVDDGSSDACGPVTLSLDNTTFSCADLPGLPEWLPVGPPGVSAGAIDYPSLAIAPDGTAHVAYQGLGNGNTTTVLRWDGIAWMPLGGPGISAGEAYYQSLAIAPDGTVYVAYRDEANGSKATVLHWDGAAWTPLGGAGISDARADFTSLAIAPDGTPYVAYQDHANGRKTTVLKWNGAAWQPVGNVGISAGSAYYQSLAIASGGAPYVAYLDRINGQKTTVLQWNGTTWAALGGPGISADRAYYQSLAIAPDGTPYVAYEDRGNGRKTAVLEWNGSTWMPLGGPGISAGSAEGQSLAIAPDGTPYVAYRDHSNGSKTTVLQWDGAGWSAIGGPGISADKSEQPSLAIAPDGTPFAAYLDEDNGDGATVLRYTAPLPTTTLTVTNPGGISATCTAEVTVTDGLPPVPDVDPLPSLTAGCPITLTPPTATDNCAGAIIATTTDPLSYASPGTYTVTWLYDDGNGNTSIQTQTVTIGAVSIPVAACRDIAVPLDAAGTATVLPEQLDDGSYDHCGPVTLGLDNSLFDCSDLSAPATVTLTVSNPDGETATCTAEITIIDDLPPAPDTGPLPDITSGCEVALTPPTATDNCAGLITATTADPLTYASPGAYTVTWLYDDGNGNTATQTQAITITAPEGPMAFCRDVTIPLDATGQATLTPAMVDDGSFDACGPVTLSLDHTDFGCADLAGLPEWRAMGGEGISASGTDFQSLAIAADGTPYVAYRDHSNGYKTTVLQWNGATWNPLGGAGISDNIAWYQSLAIAPDGTPYVAYLDGANMGKTTVLKWNGATWNPLGGAGISDGIAEYQSLAIAPDGTPYVAYQDRANGRKTTVLKWNGSAWNPLGGAGISAGRTRFNSLAIAPDGKPYVAYQDWTNGAKTTVLEWNGATWNSLGGAGISAGLAYTQSLAIAPDGTPYVAYQDRANGRKTTVLKWNGTNWTALGGAAISDGEAGGSSLAMAPDGTPFVAYQDGANGFKMTVLKWNGSTWGPLGGAGISDGSAYSQSLAIAPDGTPYVAYSDDANGDKTTVLKYAPLLPTATLTVTNADGLSATCTAEVTVIDDLPPTPDSDPLPDITAGCEVALTPPTATDNCAGAVTATTADPLTYSIPGTHTVNWTYEDGNGNISTQTQTVTITPVSIPIASCQDIVVPLDGSGTATIGPEQIDDGSYDPCGPVTLSLDNTTFDCSGLPGAGGWAALGTPGVSDGNTSWESLAIAPDGTAYTAFRDNANGGATTVLQWDGTSWTALGGPAISDGEAQYQSIAVAPNGTPYVAYTDIYNGKKTTVLRWDGTAWTALGGPGISGGATTYQSLAVAPDGTPYIAYSDNDYGKKTVVQQWDGTAWAPLGGPGISDGLSSNQSLAIASDGTPYVAYSDDTQGLKTTVLQWDGVAWTALGGPGISDGIANYQSLAIAPDGTPYVAYRDEANGIATTVLRWDGSGWAAMGGTSISAGIAGFQSLAFAPDGTLYVAYIDEANGRKTTVLQWTGSGWTALGGVGISDGLALWQSLAIAPDGTPVVAYSDFAQSGKATVLKYTFTLPTTTLTVTSQDGETSTCTATVTLIDEQAPVPDTDPLPDVTADCEVTLTPPTATDLCFGTIPAFTSDPLTYIGPGTYTVSWTYLDGSGNSATQQQTVVIDDMGPPVAQCQDVAVELDAAGMATLNAKTVDDESYDLCGPVVVSLDITEFSCADLPGMPEWAALGGAGSSAGSATFQSLAFAPDGTPYVAYSDNPIGNKATVLQWDGAAWTALGGAGISSGLADWPSLAIAPDGTPYIAYSDGANSFKATVLQWDGAAWTALGGTGISADWADFQSLAIASDGTPYVAYSDWGNGFKTTVLQWDGAAWTALGGAGISADYATYQSLAIAPDGTPYVAYQDYGNGIKTTVLQWNGTAWVPVGSAGISAGTASFQSLAIAPDGTPHVAYRDEANGNKTTVLRWDGAAWAPLGGIGISAGPAYYQSLAIAPDGMPYVAYSDDVNGDKTTVLRWDGTAWAPVDAPGISAGRGDYQSLAIAPDGTPHVAYSDGANLYKTTVLEYAPPLPIVTLTVTDASGNTATCTARATVEDPFGACCPADAGDILNSLPAPQTTLEFPIGADPVSLFFSYNYDAPDEEDPGAGFDYALVLIDFFGDIVQFNTAADANFGDFDLSGLSAGTYTVHGLSYSTDNTPASVGPYLDGIVSDGLPEDISYIVNDGNTPDFCLDLDSGPVDGQSTTIVMFDPAAFRPGGQPGQAGAVPDIQLYPNPTTDAIHLGLSAFLGQPAEISAYDGLGQLLLQRQLAEIAQPTERIGLERFAAGVYWIKIRIAGYEEVVKRVVKIER